MIERQGRRSVSTADAGLRDRLVMLQRGTEGKGPSNLPIMTWANLGKEWLSRADVRGSERIAAAQFQSSVDSEWELPYRSDMDPELVDVPKFRRLSYQGRTYQITRAWTDDRHEGRAIRIVTLATTKL